MDVHGGVNRVNTGTALSGSPNKLYKRFLFGRRLLGVGVIYLSAARLKYQKTKNNAESNVRRAILPNEVKISSKEEKKRLKPRGYDTRQLQDRPTRRAHVPGRFFGTDGNRSGFCSRSRLRLDISASRFFERRWLKKMLEGR